VAKTLGASSLEDSTIHRFVPSISVYTSAPSRLRFATDERLLQPDDDYFAYAAARCTEVLQKVLLPWFEANTTPKQAMEAMRTVRAAEGWDMQKPQDKDVGFLLATQQWAQAAAILNGKIEPNLNLFPLECAAGLRFPLIHVCADKRQIVCLQGMAQRNCDFARKEIGYATRSPARRPAHGGKTERHVPALPNAAFSSRQMRLQGTVCVTK